MSPASYAATMGHSRLLSSAGQALRIEVPITLTADEVGSLVVSVAPASAWTQAGLRPPVDPATLHISVAKGYARNTQLIRISSDQTFDQPVADVLLDIRTSSGQQRHQVSLLAYAGQAANQAAAVADQAPASGARSATATGSQAAGKRIRVREGDTMFGIAERNAVSDVTVFQMMIALQRANPRAFIDGNLHLVKAGATLNVPDKATLTAISDREARRIYQRHVQAFALYRQRLAGNAAVLASTEDAAQGVVGPAGGEPAIPEAPAPRDQLRLSGATAGNSGNSGPAAGTSESVTDTPAGSGAVATGNGANPSPSAGSPASAGSPGAGAQSSDDVKADDALAAQKRIEESSERVSTLEENVKHLNEALRAQGEAAKELVVDGAIELGRSIAGAASAITDAASSILGGEPRTSVDPAGTGASPTASSPGSGATPPSTSTVQSERESGQTQSQADVAQAGTAGLAAVGGGSNSNGTSSGNDKSGATTSAGGPGTNPTQDATVPAGEGQTSASPQNAPTTVANAGTPAGAGDITATTPAPAAGATAAGSPAGPAVNRPAPAVAKAAGSSAPESGALPTAGATPERSATNRAERTGPANIAQPNNPAGVSQPIENKADRIVNWIQENTLGVLTALLTLIILAIAWLLRRANAARRDGEGHGGRITEAMVQEKLDAISLDLSHQPAEDTGPRS